jgi:hypothetical protein
MDVTAGAGGERNIRRSAGEWISDGADCINLSKLFFHRIL